MATYPTSKPTLTSPHEDWRNKVPVKAGGTDSESKAAKRASLPPGESPPSDKEGIEKETEKKTSKKGFFGREKKTEDDEEEETKVEKADVHIKKCVKCDESPEKVTSSKEVMYSCMTEKCSAYNSWVTEKEWQKRNKKAEDADEEIEESE